MTILFIILLIIASITVGILFGLHLRPQSYHGVIKIIESETGGIVYSLELAGNPELLVFQKEVRLKVMPPNYEDLQALLREEIEE